KAPFVRAHDKELDGRLGHDARVDALEPVVEPAQVLDFEIDVAGWAKVEVAELGRLGDVVRPRDAVAFLIFARMLGETICAHADLAVAPGLFGNPFERVVAVAPVVVVGIKRTFRLEAPPVVLNNAGVAASGPPDGPFNMRAMQRLTRRAQEDDGPFAAALGQ